MSKVVWHSWKCVLVVRGLVQVWFVGAIILMSMTVSGPRSWSGVSSSVVQGVQVEGLGVLDLWSFDWDSVVDHWNVLRSVPGSGSLVSWSVGSWAVVWGWSVVSISGGNLSVRGSMESLGVLDFWGFDWDTIVDHWDVDGSVPLLSWGIMVIPVVTSWAGTGSNVGVGSKMSSLGSGNFRGIGRNVRSGADRSHQQH